MPLPVRKTKLMKQIEAQYGRPLEELLPELVNELGLSGAAEKLDISKASIGYWILKLHLLSSRVLLKPGESVRIERDGPGRK